MAQKRKMDHNAAVEESEKALFSTFQTTANYLSQFYSQCVNQQKLAFQAGETYSLLKLNEWMLEKAQEGKMVTVPEIIGYLQDKLRSWIPGVEAQEQGGGGSEPEDTSQQVEFYLGASSSAQNAQEEDSYPEMKMEITSDGDN